MTTSLIAGARRGVGQEVARQLAKLGHHVLIGSRTASNAAATVDEITSAGGRATIVKLDIAKPESIDQAAAAVKVSGDLDVLINNAAITYDAWQKAIDPDLRTFGKRSKLTLSVHGADGGACSAAR